MKTLVVYYSRSGHTEQLANEIAKQCKADIDRIRDAGVDRSGLWGYLRSGWQSLSAATPAILPAGRNPADYELVVIGTPVWNWGLAPPRHAQPLSRFCRAVVRLSASCLAAPAPP